MRLCEPPPLVCITSRPPSFKESTKRQLQAALGPFNLSTEVLFTRLYDGGEAVGKSELVGATGLEYFVEDAPNYASDIVEHTDCTVLLCDQPWNQDAEKHDRIVRMGTYARSTQWMSIFSFLKGRSYGQV